MAIATARPDTGPHAGGASRSAASAILSAGVVVGVLDTLLAMSLWHVGPVPIYLSIASGVLGIAAFDGGLPTAALGMFLHFFIATTAAGVYWFAGHAVSLLRRPLITHWFPFGLVYGIAVYYFMQMVVYLSRFPVSNGQKPLWRVMGSIVGHAFLVGLPIAWFSQRHSQAPAAEQQHD